MQCPEDVFFLDDTDDVQTADVFDDREDADVGFCEFGKNAFERDVSGDDGGGVVGEVDGGDKVSQCGVVDEVAEFGHVDHSRKLSAGVDHGEVAIIGFLDEMKDLVEGGGGLDELDVAAHDVFHRQDLRGCGPARFLGDDESDDGADGVGGDGGFVGWGISASQEGDGFDLAAGDDFAFEEEGSCQFKDDDAAKDDGAEGCSERAFPVLLNKCDESDGDGSLAEHGGAQGGGGGIGMGCPSRAEFDAEVFSGGTAEDISCAEQSHFQQVVDVEFESGEDEESSIDGCADGVDGGFEFFGVDGDVCEDGTDDKGGEQETVCDGEMIHKPGFAGAEDEEDGEENEQGFSQWEFAVGDDEDGSADDAECDTADGQREEGHPWCCGDAACADDDARCGQGDEQGEECDDADDVVETDHGEDAVGHGSPGFVFLENKEGCGWCGGDGGGGEKCAEDELVGEGCVAGGGGDDCHDRASDDDEEEGEGRFCETDPGDGFSDGLEFLFFKDAADLEEDHSEGKIANGCQGHGGVAERVVDVEVIGVESVAQAGAQGDAAEEEPDDAWDVDPSRGKGTGDARDEHQSEEQSRARDGGDQHGAFFHIARHGYDDGRCPTHPHGLAIILWKLAVNGILCVWMDWLWVWFGIVLLVWTLCGD